MEARDVIAISLLALMVPGQVASQAAEVLTVSGSVIQGEVQGLIVAKAVTASTAMPGFYRVALAVFRGPDIRSIEDSGIVAVALNQWTSDVADPSSAPMPDAAVAWLIATDTLQAWSQPTGPVRLKILGELQPPRDGAAARILPSVRVKTRDREVSIAVAQLPDATRGTKSDSGSRSN
jgi:hypothetical protein